MLKFAKVINEETKQCAVGSGDNDAYYKSIGFEELDVEETEWGDWYLKGYIPQKTIETIKEDKRIIRDNLLKETDVKMLPDYPITAEEKALWIKYRQYLRDFPESESFPNVEVLTFEDWNK